MAQSDNKTRKIIELDWISLLLILVLMGFAIYFGVKYYSRNSEATANEQQHIQKQAILEYQKDSLQKQIKPLQERIVLLEADVQLANKNTSDASKTALEYKKKYLEAKATKIPDACDSSEILQSCEKALSINENLVLIMKANVLSYAKLSDTLRLQNTYLSNALTTCDLLVEDQKKEVGDLRKKVRRRGMMNAVIGGILGGVIIILAVK